MNNETTELSLERMITELVKKGGCGFREVRYRSERDSDGPVFNTRRALDENELLGFISDTQPKQYGVVRKRAGDSYVARILDSFDASVQSRGLVNVLRNGFDVMGVRLRAAYFKPEDESDRAAMANYESNRLLCARQFHYSHANPRDSIDVVLLVNGIPVVAIELKNKFTGQSVDDAVRQFREDRDCDELFFRPDRRCLVCFAIDNYRVEMTTRMNGASTVFLPFDQGSNGPGRPGRAGNPIPVDDFPTHYMFDEILSKDGLMGIIGDFLVSDDDDFDPKVVFPRYHQLDCVRSMVRNACEDGPGHSYLIQHSAGSGKSNTIAWLAFKLLNLHRDGISIFDSVIICVHRTVLNDQLNKTVSMFQSTSGMVALVDNSAELKEALVNGNKVIVSTIQKFGMINESIRPYKRNFAIIFDEAHSSTTGRLNKKTKIALGVKEMTDDERTVLETEYDTEEGILRAYEKIRADGDQDNMSFFAFTATPTEKTLHAFGKRLDDGSHVPHHVYSMMQAIDEGYICDVLEDYLTYKVYFDFIQDASKSEDPMVKSREAMAKLRKLAAGNELLIMDKARIIVDYFRDHVDGDLGGEAKAMLVVDGRETVLKYREAIINACREEGYDGIRPMAAFSGTLDHEDRKVTEQEFNRLPDGRPVRSSEMAKVFDGPHFNLMIAADKFQVGFDQPKLTTMFVDKILRGSEAVQTLSRLNRVIPRTVKHTHVLDFANSTDDIREAFGPYYEDAETESGYDPAFVYTKRTDLESFLIIDEKDVRRFSEIFKENDPDFHKTICGLLEPARRRFVRLMEESPEDAERFRRIARSMEIQYNSVTTFHNFMDPYFSYLADYIHYLLRSLPKKKTDSLPDMEKLVEMDRYRVVMSSRESIGLSKGAPLANPRDGLSPAVQKRDPLSEVIKRCNRRYGLPDSGNADKRSIIMDAMDEVVREMGRKGDVEDFREWSLESLIKEFKGKAIKAIVKCLMDNSEFSNAMLEDQEILEEAAESLLETFLLEHNGSA